MAVQCPAGFDPEKFRAKLAARYAHAATDPEGDAYFHRGPEYAAEHFGYDIDALRALPETSTIPFSGVGNPFDLGTIDAGETVLDVGCGSGVDLLLAAQRVGPSGTAIGVDMTAEVLDLTRASALALGLEQVELRLGDAESLPVDEATVDVVISNGVLNLATDKAKAFAEIARVLVPGGRLQLADLVVADERSEGRRNDIDLWAS